MTDHTTGDTYFQDLTFQNVTKGTQLRTLELPFVMVRRQLPPTSLTIDLAGRTAGDRIPLDTELRIGSDVLRVLAATLEDDGALLLDFDARSVQTVARDLGTTRGFARFLNACDCLSQPAPNFT